MLQQALQKIQSEVAADPKNKFVAVIAKFLMDHVRTNPDDAEKILTEGKTILGSLDAMKEEAGKNQSGGVGMLSDEEGFAVVLKYYGVEVAQSESEPVAAGFNINVDDLL